MAQRDYACQEFVAVESKDPATRTGPRSALWKDRLAQYFAGSVCFAKRCLCGRQTGYRQTERRTAHIVEPEMMAEDHRVRIAAMLAANAELDILPRLATFFHSDLHQLADARGINRGKRICLDDAHFCIQRQKCRRVIAAHTQASLRQIVSAKTEKLS